MSSIQPAHLYLTDIPVAERCSIARGTVWRWKRDGRFPKAVKLGPSVTRWRLSDLQEWEASLQMGLAVALM